MHHNILIIALDRFYIVKLTNVVSSSIKKHIFIKLTILFIPGTRQNYTKWWTVSKITLERKAISTSTLLLTLLTSEVRWPKIFDVNKV